MAATLLEIKSRLLLPVAPKQSDNAEEIDPRAELVTRLLEYQRYQGTVDTLREWEDFRRNLFFRGSLENPDDYVLPTALGEMDINALAEALLRVLANAGLEDEKVSSVMPKRRVSLRMKMAELIRIVGKEKSGIEFDRLFELPCPRYEIVLTFLALLELLKMKKLSASQANAKHTILLKPIEDETK